MRPGPLQAGNRKGKCRVIESRRFDEVLRLKMGRVLQGQVRYRVAALTDDQFSTENLIRSALAADPRLGWGSA